MTASDVFLSHPPELEPDAKALARDLAADGLTVKGRVALLPGDLWDELHYIQRGTRVTAALIDPASAGDWYQNDDLARAIALQQEGRHRVLPIYRGAAAPEVTPYGLERMKPILWQQGSPSGDVVASVRRLAESMAAPARPSRVEAAKTVFLLYARDDVDWALWIADALQGGGFDVRLADWDLTAGQNKWLYAEGQLRSDRVLLLVSRHMPADGEVAAMWSAAYDGDPTGARAQLVPVLLDDARVPALLGGRVAIDLRPWLDDAAQAASVLLGALQRRVRQGLARFPGRR